MADLAAVQPQPLLAIVTPSAPANKSADPKEFLDAAALEAAGLIKKGEPLVNPKPAFTIDSLASDLKSKNSQVLITALTNLNSVLDKASPEQIKEIKGSLLKLFENKDYKVSLEMGHVLQHKNIFGTEGTVKLSKLIAQNGATQDHKRAALLVLGTVKTQEALETLIPYLDPKNGEFFWGAAAGCIRGFTGQADLWTAESFQRTQLFVTELSKLPGKANSPSVTKTQAKLLELAAERPELMKEVALTKK